MLGSETAIGERANSAPIADEEIVGAAEPSMAMCGDGGLLILGSSVHRKQGYMYRKWRELWGKDDADTLVWLAPSATMNTRLPQSIIDEAMANDPPRARAEYLSEWRSDLSDFIPLDVIENATDYGVYERVPQPRRVRYFAFADAAGGTGADSFALAIAHREGSSHIIDAVRESKPRFVPAQVIASLAQLLKSYGISTVNGDAFAGGFHSSEWTTHGITFVPAERTTSENYLTCLPMFLAGRVRLVDNVSAAQPAQCAGTQTRRRQSRES